jgi:hypothetical protein
MNGMQTHLQLSVGEDWKVPTDHGPVSFNEWELERQQTPNATKPTRASDMDLMEAAWKASRQRYCATLRRVGWLDQKGRVWTEIPPGVTFDGGSLTPLLIDVRED